MLNSTQTGYKKYATIPKMTKNKRSFQKTNLSLGSSQRTLTIEGRITVRLVYSLTTLNLTKRENMLLFTFKDSWIQSSIDPSPYSECSLV